MDSYPAPVATIVLVHGFTQTRRAGADPRRRSAATTTWSPSMPPATAASDVRADLWPTRTCSRRRQGHLRRLLDGRAAWPARRPRPSRPRRWARPGQRDGRHRGPHRTCSTRRARRGAGRSLERDGVDAFLDGGWRSRCSRRCRRALATTMPAGRNTVDGLASSLRLAGTGHARAAVGPARRAHDARAGRLGRARRASSPAAAHRMSDAIGANATLARHRPTPATRATSSSRPRSRAVLREWLASGHVARARRRAARRRRAATDRSHRAPGSAQARLPPRARPAPGRRATTTATNASSGEGAAERTDERQHQERDEDEQARRASACARRRAAPRACACPPVVGRDVAQVVDDEQRSDAAARRRSRRTTASPVIRSTARTSSPTVATKPKNTNTNTSPRPR